MTWLTSEVQVVHKFEVLIVLVSYVQIHYEIHDQVVYKVTKVKVRSKVSVVYHIIKWNPSTSSLFRIWLLYKVIFWGPTPWNDIDFLQNQTLICTNEGSEACGQKSALETSNTVSAAKLKAIISLQLMIHKLQVFHYNSHHNDIV